MNLEKIFSGRAGEMKVKVSVILPAYNAENTIRRAICSILDQSMSSFELIIIDDGSTDGTLSEINSLRDPRIVLISRENRGLSSSLNEAILKSKGKYIARMDADDFSDSERLRVQSNFLDNNKNISVVGSAVVVKYMDGSERVRRRPVSPDQIRRLIVLFNPIAHSTVMIRKSDLSVVGFYDESKDGSRTNLVEDYDLWVRFISAGFQLSNIKEPLLEYYKSSSSILSSQSRFSRLRQQINSRKQIIVKLRLPFWHYGLIPPVILFSVLSGAGLKLDGMFNFLSMFSKEHRKSTTDE